MKCLWCLGTSGISSCDPQSHVLRQGEKINQSYAYQPVLSARVALTSSLHAFLLGDSGRRELYKSNTGSNLEQGHTIDIIILYYKEWKYNIMTYFNEI